MSISTFQNSSNYQLLVIVLMVATRTSFALLSSSWDTISHRKCQSQFLWYLDYCSSVRLASTTTSSSRSVLSDWLENADNCNEVELCGIPPCNRDLSQYYGTFPMVLLPITWHAGSGLERNCLWCYSVKKMSERPERLPFLTFVDNGGGHKTTFLSSKPWTLNPALCGWNYVVRGNFRRSLVTIRPTSSDAIPNEALTTAIATTTMY